MKVRLRRVTRENWEEALNLKVNEYQHKFAPTVAVSLAKVYIKPDGENVDYIPFAIFDNDLMVGFIMHAYEKHTTNMYWINGFIIDKNYQGRGYGRAALSEMIHWIKNKFNVCKEISLTVYEDNQVAKELYKSLGFLPTKQFFGEEEVWRLSIRC